MVAKKKLKEQLQQQFSFDFFGTNNEEKEYDENYILDDEEIQQLEKEAENAEEGSNNIKGISDQLSDRLRIIDEKILHLPDEPREKEFKPKYSISNKMIINIVDISNKLGVIGSKGHFEKRKELRNSNRLDSIYSTIAIDTNEFTKEDIEKYYNNSDEEIISTAPKTIKRVLLAFERLDSINPYFMDNQLLILGNIQNGFNLDNESMDKLKKIFEWMNKNKENIHPILLALIFHCEFINLEIYSKDTDSFAARFWQTSILGSWNPILYYVPVEKYILDNKLEYLETLAKCKKRGHADLFIEYMLCLINKGLSEMVEKITDNKQYTSTQVNKLLSTMKNNTPYTTMELMKILKLKSRDSLRDHYITPALEAGLIRMTNPDKPTSRNQRYIKE